jgi:hypothetical protein
MSARRAGKVGGRARGWTAALVGATGLASIAFAPSSALGDAVGWPPPEVPMCKPTSKAVDEAKTLFRLGSDAFATSNYTDAIKYWRDAYVRDCTAHVLLKNLGKAYEADGQYGAAVDAYRLYRVRGKITGDELDLIDAKIANLSKRIAGGPIATSSATGDTSTSPTATTSGTTVPTGVPTTAPTTDTTAAPTATTTSTATPPPPPPPSTGGSLTWLPPAMTIAGGVIVLAGGYLWVSENSTISTNTDTFNSLKCGTGPKLVDRPQCNQLASDTSSASTPRLLGAIGAGVGLALAGTGIALWATGFGRSEPSKATVALSHVAPAIGPGFAGISLSGAF